MPVQTCPTQGWFSVKSLAHLHLACAGHDVAQGHVSSLLERDSKGPAHMPAAPASLLLYMANPQLDCRAARHTLPWQCPQADGDALRAAAGSLNAFAGDGSFMDQFERKQEAEAASPPRCPPCSLTFELVLLPQMAATHRLSS